MGERVSVTNRPFATRLCACALAAALLGPAVARGGTEWWSPVGPHHGEILALAIDPVSPNVLYAGGVGGVLKSLDGGASWRLANSNMPAVPVFSVAIDPKTTSTVYAGGSAGVYKTVNGGSSWQAFISGLNAARAFAL